MKFVLIFLLFVSSFASAKDRSDAMEEFDSWLSSAFENSNFSNRKEIQSLGTPLSEKVNVEQPTRVGGPLENVQYKFPGLNLCLLRETQSLGKVWLYSIEVTSNKWLIGKNIRVGESLEVLKPFSEFKAKETNEYCGHVNCMKVTESNGKIAVIHIEIEVD